ncbi:uncharacterized protein LOC144905599 [Branchiostoma floridae x Branchiostoma belcheri]
MRWSAGVLYLFLTLAAVAHAAPIRPFGRTQGLITNAIYTEEAPGFVREGSGHEPDDGDVFIRPRPGTDTDTGNEVETNVVVGHGLAGLSPGQQCRERWGRALMECFHDYRRAMNDLGELLLSSEGQTLFCGVQMELYQCYQTVLDQPFCEYDNEISTRQTKIQTDMRVIHQKCTGFR